MPLTTHQSANRVNRRIDIFMYYFAIYWLLFFQLTIVLIYLNKFSALLQGSLLFKYLFCMISSDLMNRADCNRSFNTFGRGYALLCGLYFLLFTAGVYYLIGVKMWNTTSVHQILPNLIWIIDDLLKDVVEQLPPAYLGCFLFTTMLIVPTPILGVYMVREMYIEFKYPTVGYLNWDMNVPRRPRWRGGRKWFH